MSGITNLEDIEKSSNILLSAISHLETAKDLIDKGISKLDSTLIDDLPIVEMNQLAEKYINSVRFVQSRLDNMVKANTLAVYAPPDIMFGDWK
ncbi:hypothetical protein [uncultured Eubacterium sp.]|uniref:hypothetical protein n=1 Tax=uncultured Eubacterium sp. TaxID=165185 RepID=UPI0025D74A60|nr:hypothetical protein [uncultured Eubacterium sp.]